MAGRRKFSNAFKSQVVEEFLAGEATQAQLARRYDICDQLIIQWRRRYGEGKLEQTVNSSSKDKRIKEVERMVGRLTMENELLKKGRTLRSSKTKRVFIRDQRTDHPVEYRTQ